MLESFHCQGGLTLAEHLLTLREQLQALVGLNDEPIKLLLIYISKIILGRVSDSASASSNDLYYMEGLIMSNADCGMYYFGIYDSHVCIEGVNGRSTCSG